MPWQILTSFHALIHHLTAFLHVFCLFYHIMRTCNKRNSEKVHSHEPRAMETVRYRTSRKQSRLEETRTLHVSFTWLSRGRHVCNWFNPHKVFGKYLHILMSLTHVQSGALKSSSRGNVDALKMIFKWKAPINMCVVCFKWNVTLSFDSHNWLEN